MNLLDICHIGGKSIKKYDGEKKYIATGDIINNEIISYEIVNYKNKPSRANVEAKFGDVLFAKMMDTVKVLKVDEFNKDNIYSTGFYCMTPKKDVLQDYLYLYFNSDSFNYQKNKNCSGATQKAINNDGLTKISIKNIPSIEEQKNIIKKLSNINDLIRIKKEEIEKLDLLIKSQFVEMFGDININSNNYKTIKLKEISDCLTGGTPSTANKEYYQGSIPWITTVSLGKNHIDESDAVSFITEQAIDNSSTKLIAKNSILFGTRVGVGKCSINKVPLCTNQDIVAITNISKDYNLVFIKHVLDHYNNYFENQKRGATIKGIKSETVKNIDIPEVDIVIQNKYEEIVEQIDKQKFEFEKSLKKLEELQASLMQEYFG